MDIDLPASAIWTIYEQEGSWPKVATFLVSGLEIEISPALVWKVAHGKSGSIKVQRALWEKGFIDHVETTQPVPVCPQCGEVHQRFKTCPTYNRKDTRKTRAWHGSEEEAFELDDALDSMGFSSLTKFINALLGNSRTEINHGRDGYCPSVKITVYMENSNGKS